MQLYVDIAFKGLRVLRYMTACGSTATRCFKGVLRYNRMRFDRKQIFEHADVDIAAQHKQVDTAITLLFPNFCAQTVGYD